MVAAVGKKEYELGASPVRGAGVSWTPEELEAALSEAVAPVMFDDAGKADLRALLEGVPDTEFEKAEVDRIINAGSPSENWRVGEAIAEAYITHHHECTFPWPDVRDERKAGSSLPGADLVGFQRDGDANRFAFGEVKTSSDGRHPPGAMHGRTGLKQQLEDLRDNVKIRDGLVKYLAHRAVNAPWADRFREASTHYIKCNTDVRLFGILVRDVIPHEDDLKVRVTKLSDGCPINTVIELLGLYMSAASIDSLSEMATAACGGGRA
jgi:hypothetical protein